MKFTITIKQQTQANNGKARFPLYKPSNDKNMDVDNGLQTLEELLQSCSIKIFCYQCEKDVTKQTIIISEEEKEIDVLQEKNNIGLGSGQGAGLKQGERIGREVNSGVGSTNRGIGSVIGNGLNLQSTLNGRNPNMTTTRRRGRPSQMEIHNRKQKAKLLALNKKNKEQSNTQSMIHPNQTGQNESSLASNKKKNTQQSKKSSQKPPVVIEQRATRLTRQQIRNSTLNNSNTKPKINTNQIFEQQSDQKLTKLKIKQQQIKSQTKIKSQNIQQQNNQQKKQQIFYSNDQNNQSSNESQKQAEQIQKKMFEQIQKDQEDQDSNKNKFQQQENNMRVAHNNYDDIEDLQQLELKLLEQGQLNDFVQGKQEKIEIEEQQFQEDSQDDEMQGQNNDRVDYQEQLNYQQKPQQNQNVIKRIQSMNIEDQQAIKQENQFKQEYQYQNQLSNKEGNIKKQLQGIKNQYYDDGIDIEGHLKQQNQLNISKLEQKKMSNLAHRLYCVSCFANLQEYPDVYYIRKSLKFAPKQSTWTFYDQLCLLNGLKSWGFGNWAQIQQFMDFNSSVFLEKDIEDHYQKVYLKQNGPQFLKINTQNNKINQNQEINNQKSEFDMSQSKDLWIPKKKTFQQLLTEYYYPPGGHKPLILTIEQQNIIAAKIAQNDAIRNGNWQNHHKNQNPVPRRGRPPSLSVQQRKLQPSLVKMNSNGYPNQKQDPRQKISPRLQKNAYNNGLNNSSNKFSNLNSSTSLANLPSADTYNYQNKTRRRDKIDFQQKQKSQNQLQDNQQQDQQLNDRNRQKQASDQEDDSKDEDQNQEKQEQQKDLNEIQLKPRSSSKLLPGNPTEGGKGLPSYQHMLKSQEYLQQKQNQKDQSNNSSFSVNNLSKPNSSSFQLKGQNVYSYNPKRRQFEIIEYDYYAESMLAHLEFTEEDTQQQQDLKIKIIEQYNRRLDQRIKRRQFVIEHRLLDTDYMLKNLSKYQKNSASLRFFQPFRRLIDTNQKYYQIVDKYNELSKRKSLTQGVIKVNKKLQATKKNPKFKDMIEYLTKKKEKKQLLGHKAKGTNDFERKVYIRDYNKKDMKKMGSSYIGNGTKNSGINRQEISPNKSYMSRSQQRSLRTNYGNNSYYQQSELMAKRSDDENQNYNNYETSNMMLQSANQTHFGLNPNNSMFKNSGYNHQGSYVSQYFLSSLLNEDDCQTIQRYLAQKKSLSSNSSRQNIIVQKNSQQQFKQENRANKINLPIKLSKGYYLKDLKEFL